MHKAFTANNKQDLFPLLKNRPPTLLYLHKINNKNQLNPCNDESTYDNHLIFLTIKHSYNS